MKSYYIVVPALVLVVVLVGAYALLGMTRQLLRTSPSQKVSTSTLPHMATEPVTVSSTYVEGAPIVTATLSGHTVSLTWTTVPKATSYTIYRSERPSPAPPKTIAIDAHQPFSDSPQPHGATFYYQVAGVAGTNELVKSGAIPVAVAK
ncbi:MAG TPA: hypothetical protein VGK19_07050 [Capsulimonadaceae bacterium]|jgi:fibronectin type 3 domain-containing protein